MNKKLFVLAIILVAGCQTESIDYEKEYAAIEESRAGFEQAIAEGRWSDLGDLSAEGIITVGAGSADYAKMYELGQNRGTFPYDSIKMHPVETIIVNDTLAYDFGYSEIFYTDENGNTVKLDNSFLAIIKKEEDGVWRLFREVMSTNIPDVLMELKK